MKLTVIMEKLMRYLQAFDDQFVETADLIDIKLNVREDVVCVYIAGQFYDAITAFMCDDNIELIDRAAGIIRAALLVKRLQRAGK